MDWKIEWLPMIDIQFDNVFKKKSFKLSIVLSEIFKTLVVFLSSNAPHQTMRDSLFFSLMSNIYFNQQMLFYAKFWFVLVSIALWEWCSDCFVYFGFDYFEAFDKWIVICFVCRFTFRKITLGKLIVTMLYCSLFK